LPARCLFVIVGVQLKPSLNSVLQQLIGSEMSKKKKSKGGYVFLVVALLFVGGAYTIFFGDKSSIIESQPLLVTIEIGSIENTIAAAGSLKPSNYVDVGAQVSGQLQRLYVGMGVGYLMSMLGISIKFTTLPAVSAFSCAAATGLIFGFASARKASRLDPVVPLAND
jgi:ABC-type antimicrobial peptide transport system permease subunit